MQQKRWSFVSFQLGFVNLKFKRTLIHILQVGRVVDGFLWESFSNTKTLQVRLCW